VASPVKYVVADTVGQLTAATITPTVDGPDRRAGAATQSSDGSVLPRTGTDPWKYGLLGLLLALLGSLILSGELRARRPRRASLNNGRS
jgi:LPXTG-motif cell wall-anchored protein